MANPSPFRSDSRYARWLLIGAVLLYKATGVRLPHHWVTAVTNPSWLHRQGHGHWQRFSIDSRGRKFKS